MKTRIITGIIFIIAVIAVASCDTDMEFKRYYIGGEPIYRQRCQNCHGANGEGLSSLYPALNDGTFLKTNKNLLACYVNNGIKGKIMVINGKSFVGDMPANDIAPVDIAKVLTYVGNSFGNKMGTFSSDEVSKQLKDCK
ncbi:hypothetical protein A0256_15790 [Mucilaginibacter sp. PAMC 26640]|nr:hypothetical protein A0256_15790 [Mucilaginibacter sp. PAMC 26640]